MQFPVGGAGEIVDLDVTDTRPDEIGVLKSRVGGGSVPWVGAFVFCSLPG